MSTELNIRNQSNSLISSPSKVYVFMKLKSPLQTYLLVGSLTYLANLPAVWDIEHVLRFHAQASDCPPFPRSRLAHLS